MKPNLPPVEYMSPKSFEDEIIAGAPLAIRSHLWQFKLFGYTTIPLGITQAEADEIRRSIEESLPTAKTQESIYHYSDSPRIFEQWKTNPLVARLALHPVVTGFLKLAYGAEPKPFQVINFIRGSEQPTHSDSIHFSTVPELWMSGAWINLEPVGTYNGSLKVYPMNQGSYPFDGHLLDFCDFGIETPEYGKQGDAYAEYEQKLQALIEDWGMQPRIVVAEVPSVTLWRANVLHGGSKSDPNLTRWTQATHYYYDVPGVATYCPLFSDRAKGKISLKDVSNKDIAAYAKEKGWI